MFFPLEGGCLIPWHWAIKKKKLKKKTRSALCGGIWVDPLSWGDQGTPFKEPCVGIVDACTLSPTLVP